MNNQQQNGFRHNQQINQAQLPTNIVQQNVFKGNHPNYPSSPLHQMENIQFLHSQNPQGFTSKPERQKNALYMSSMEFSHNQNNGFRVENYGVNMKPNGIVHGRQPNLTNFDNFQRGQLTVIPDPQTINNTSQSVNMKNENLQFQKKSGIFIDQNRKESEKSEKPRSKKNIEQIQAIKRQLEALNGKMQKLGVQQQQQQFEENKLTKQGQGQPNQSQAENIRNFTSKGQIAHSMIVSNNNSMSFNANLQAGKFGNNIHVHQKKPMLSLQETYQKMKNQKVQNQNQKSFVPSFLSARQENPQNGSENSNNNNKNFLNFATKQRKASKIVSSHGLNIEEAVKQLNENKNQGSLGTQGNQGNYVEAQSYKNLKYSMIDQSQQQQPYRVLPNQNNYGKTTNQGYIQSNHNQSLQFNDISKIENKLAFNAEKFSQPSISVNKNYNKLDQTKADSQSSQASQFSESEQVSSPKTLFKKKGAKPQYFVSNASEQDTLKKVESVENIMPFGNTIPQKIKKEDFLIGKKMGKGQFGQVNLVRHKKTGFLCAMKTMQKKQIRQQKYEGQIARQLSIQFYLSHRNITPLYGYFQDEQNVYLLVEFCPDGHLLGVLKKVRRMEEQDVSPIIKQIIQGIDYIHKEKIIHRDIKPQNILFSNGVAKIVDFGWAVYRGLGLRKTASGSPLYYSPQIVMGTQYDQKIDIWDIGMMTYECLLGKVPFKVYTEMDLNRIATDQVTFPSYVDTTAEAQDFILKILQKKPEDRMTVREMLRHPFITKYAQKKLPIEIMTDIHNLLK